MLRISVTFCNQLRVQFSFRWRCRYAGFLAGELITVSNAAGNPAVEHKLLWNITIPRIEGNLSFEIYSFAYCR